MLKQIKQGDKMKTKLENVIKLFNQKSNKDFDNLFFTDTLFYNKVTRLSFINRNVDDFANEKNCLIKQREINNETGNYKH
jgi:hypothetical protein